MENATFAYRFDLDRDYFIDFSMKYQSALPFVTLVTIRPLVCLILSKKRGHIPSGIRWAYIINQIMMTIQELNFCFLFRVHDLAPYAALYCDGPICRAGIDKPILMLILSATTIGTVPTFLLLLLKMHQQIIGTTDSMLKLSNRAQRGLILFMTAVLGSNVAGFFLFGRDCRNADEIAKIPDLAWLKARGGTLFVFGLPGRAELFEYGSLFTHTAFVDANYQRWGYIGELWMLLCSIMIITPFVATATLHSLMIMREQTLHQSLTTSTQRLQKKLAFVFLLHLFGVSGFYIFPLFMMLLHMGVDVSWMVPPWMYALARCFLIIPFTLESIQLSLVFLLKNPVHRQILKSTFLQLTTFKSNATQWTGATVKKRRNAVSTLSAIN